MIAYPELRLNTHLDANFRHSSPVPVPGIFLHKKARFEEQVLVLCIVQSGCCGASRYLVE